MADYTVDFQIIAPDNGWNKPALIAAFRKGLNPVIQTKLACRDEGRDLNVLIVLAIVLDQHLRSKARRAVR